MYFLISAVIFQSDSPAFVRMRLFLTIRAKLRKIVVIYPNIRLNEPIHLTSELHGEDQRLECNPNFTQGYINIYINAAHPIYYIVHIYIYIPSHTSSNGIAFIPFEPSDKSA